ncbi:helix-turn-helix transcriptional regulator [Proteus mirabilis]|uniref:Putative phage transcriptional regulator n=1 Tax=Proteus mirabilis TaxID=584 RepID=G8DRC4_PROMI|nr:AlpA family transcriptional regulator [Proteus mirabilis]AED98743.1 putative phage transcriptional regulator [Proteus mirabilis]MBG2763818.1 AlpA family transcriptional regulator [Proteus mirabilis]MCS6726336.1 AlpA family transcriptional regulator [Proteus mirabilis]MCW9741219.1 AlpA family transcriptional regulator [Proteus mirabilis]MDH7535666.1 AlpA family transcriptional regulator [Proteus mirabilis]
MTKRLLRLPDVIKKVGFKKSWIYQHINQGTFPRQIKLGDRSVVWLESEIDDWIEQHLLQR